MQYDANTDKSSNVPTGATPKIPANGLKGLQVSQQRLPAGMYSLLVGALDWAGNDNFEELAVTIKQANEYDSRVKIKSWIRLSLDQSAKAIYDPVVFWLFVE